MAEARSGHDAYAGQFLVVDLTRQRSHTVPLPDWLKRDYVGGKGFGARLLSDLCPAGVDPLGPENPLLFMTGPLTATAAPSMRACVVTKSPLTGIYLDAYFGGRFGPEMKYAGYDGLVILGRAPRPTYLWIRDASVEFRPAGGAWGSDALAANAWIKADVNAPEAQVVTIGQAGERLARFALICCEYNRQAGRGGAGAVMGSKNLKGVAVSGSRLVRLHDPDAFATACAAANADILASEACAALTHSGTSNAVPWSNTVGTLPVRNYYDQVSPKADRLGDAGQQKHLFLGKAACFGCPIRCSQMGAVRTGKYAHLITDIVEYESAALMGANLDIHDIRAVAHLVKLCDRFGLDSMSTGSVIGFAFEAVEKGALKIPTGVDADLRFGSVAGAEFLIRAIAFQDSELGRLLGQGVKRAAAQLGRGSEDYALHVKGLEVPGWAPRGTPGMGLAYMTADRGACHQRGFMVAYEVGGASYNGHPVETYALEKKAEILKGEQDYLAGLDTLVKCDFGAFGIQEVQYQRLLTAATGRTVTENFFRHLGERIWNLTRLFNLREGLTAADDRLPRRIVAEPLPSGPHKGRRISRADMATLRGDYYRVRGWDDQGRPTAAKLQLLGLDKKRRFDCGPQPFPDEADTHSADGP
ncbi:MAG: aldehyde ferredoxin oxidoreductase family protein [Desulfosarcinaceae bacterium]|nr:aldehyde ferredoxin oxidoreductase family protein [Desulfosarcinaceae bacterium]